MAKFTYDINTARQPLTLIFMGSIDHSNVREFEQVLNSQIESGVKRLAVDLTRINFLPSVCFGALLSCGEHAGENKAKLIVKMVPHHAALARGIGMGQVVTIVSVC